MSVHEIWQFPKHTGNKRKNAGMAWAVYLVCGLCQILMNSKQFHAFSQVEQFQLPAIMKTEKEFDNFSTFISGLEWKGKKMLLIEDNRTCILLIKEIFSETGIQILSAINGREGLRQFNKNPNTDVILLDLRLPDMDGFAVFNELQKVNPHIPVIIITACASNEVANRCRKLGLYGFMRKPLDIAGLLKMVYIVLNYKPN
jgi:CheY-like chemotaxis protein